MYFGCKDPSRKKLDLLLSCLDDAVPAEAEELAQMLAQNGCGGQLELMADTLAVE